ncbi:MAG: adenylate kinase family protein [Candidatus Sigynarchaeota archaeon]
MARILAIAGTPGVGKTTIGRAVAIQLRGEVLSIGEFVIARHLYDAWDSNRSTHVVDEDKARKALLQEIDRARARDDIDWLIIEGLMADIIADVCDLAIVLRLDPRIVKTRLEQKGYDNKKITENIQAELLGVSTYHMKKARGKDFLDLDTTGKNISEVTNIITRVVEGKEDKAAYRPGLIDWISKPGIDPAAFF